MKYTALDLGVRGVWFRKLNITEKWVFYSDWDNGNGLRYQTMDEAVNEAVLFYNTALNLNTALHPV